MRWLRPNPLRGILAAARPFERLVLATALFCLFASMGFITDLMSGGRHAGLLLATNVVFSGMIALGYAWALIVNPVLVVVPAAVHVAYTGYLVDLVPGFPLTEVADQRARLWLDGIGIAAAISLSYTGFLMFTSRTGARHVAVETEIALAREIHQALVPAIEREVGEFDFYGRSVPSGEVGGDLVDVVELNGQAWMAYVADVSGHGVSSGLVMGMVKSAIRMHMRTATTAGDLLTELNAVLQPLKHPTMFVTLAIVYCDGDGRLAFSVAGHLPILRVRNDGAVEEMTVANLPVGMMPGTRFAQAPLSLAPGETLALVTDGLTEVFDHHDCEFGLDRLKDVLAAQRDQPLEQMASSLLRDVRAHGPQSDDQTWLFIRRPAA